MARSCRNSTLSDGNVASEVRPVASSICQKRTFLSALVHAPPPRVVFTFSAWPRSLAWAGGWLAPCRCFRRRRKTDHHHRFRDPTRLFQAAFLVSREPFPSGDRCVSLRSLRPPTCHARARRQPRLTPVTMRLLSIVRKIAPVSGSIWWILRPRCCPTQSAPSAQARPESPPSPGAGIVASTRPGGRIDFLDAILGDLKQVPAVEGRSCMRGDIDRPHRLSALGIEGAQPVSGCKPDMPAVKCYTMDAVNPWKRAIFT